jgi:hypothetical protein
MHVFYLVLAVALISLVGGFAIYKHRASIKAAAITDAKASVTAIEKKL